MKNMLAIRSNWRLLWPKFRFPRLLWGPNEIMISCNALSAVSAVEPVLVVLGSALFWALNPQWDIFLCNWGNKVVCFVKTLGRKWSSVRVFSAQVWVMADGVRLGPRPDVSEKRENCRVLYFSKIRTLRNQPTGLDLEFSLILGSYKPIVKLSARAKFGNCSLNVNQLF